MLSKSDLLCPSGTSGEVRRMPRRRSNDVERPPSALRMQRLREAMGFQEQTAWARHLGIQVARWNNVEGRMPVSIEVALILVNKYPGLTLDWIYRGSVAGLTVDMATKLGELAGRTTDRSGA